MYDLVFLGGGPGGYEGAVAAAKKGLKTAVIEKDKIGGTCLHYGCIPTKTLLNTVKHIKMFKSSSRLGVKVNDFSIEMETVKKYRDSVVSKLTRGIELLFENNGVELIKGKGIITAPGRIQVEEYGTVEAKNIVIATGSVPAGLPFLKADSEFVINSRQALELHEIPVELLVIGAGAIGLEMAVIYSLLGSKVTVVEIMDQVVPGSDKEMAEMLKKELKKSRINIFTSTTVSDPKIDKKNRKISFKFFSDGKTDHRTFDKVLLSVGRIPNTKGIFSDSVNIELDKNAYIKTTNNLETSEKNIFACGDVTGQPLLAHKASHQAIAISQYIAEGKKVPEMVIPGAIFTFPEFASAGLTEEEAKTDLPGYRTGKFPYSAGSRSNAINEKNGLVKVITTEDGTLAGAHILGAEAGELMPLLTYGIQKKMKTTEFKELVFIHPTLSENIWEALGESAGFSIHI